MGFSWQRVLAALVILALGGAGANSLYQRSGLTPVAMTIQRSASDVSESQAAMDTKQISGKSLVEKKLAELTPKRIESETAISKSAEADKGEVVVNKPAAKTTDAAAAKSAPDMVTMESVTTTSTPPKVILPDHMTPAPAILDSSPAIAIDSSLSEALAEISAIAKGEGESSSSAEAGQDNASQRSNREARGLVAPELLLKPVLRVKQYSSDRIRKTNDGSVVEIWGTISEAMVNAVDGGSIARVRELIESGENINASDVLGETALLKAAWNSDAPMVRALLQMGADVLLASNNGRTPLFTGVVSGNLQVVIELLSAGAPPDATTDFAKTPLMASAWSNYSLISDLLLQHGADPNAEDDRGRTAIFYALWDRNLDVASRLLNGGASLDTVDYLGHSALDIARLRRIDLNTLASLSAASTLKLPAEWSN